MDSIETRLRDAKLGSAIDNAAGQLPEGYRIIIEIEKGSATVELHSPDDTVIYDLWSETLEDQINEAIETARNDFSFEQSSMESATDTQVNSVLAMGLRDKHEQDRVEDSHIPGELADMDVDGFLERCQARLRDAE